MMKIRPVCPKSDDMKVAFIGWLKDHDPGFLVALQETAQVFGPLAEVSYRHTDDEVQLGLIKHLDAADERLRRVTR